MPSHRHRQLRRRIKRLSKNLVPRLSDTGDYTEKELDMAAGFRLLAHAEIEAFLEESAKEAALKAITSWHANGKVSHTLGCLLSHYPKRKIPQQVLEDEKSGRSSRIHYAIQIAHGAYVHVLTKNNGVREENVKKILFPIGIKHADIDVTWLNTIDSFGRDRGFVAHNSAGAIRAIDPETEIKTVEQIVVGLGKLDTALGKLR
jgi:hypothetical protein